MKKLFILAAVACCSVVASAQIWVGGGISFLSSKTDNAAEVKTIVTSFKPTVGYDLNEKMSVCASLSFYNKKVKTNPETKNSSWYIEPFFRYNAVSFGNITLFADATLTIGSIKDVNDDSHGVFGVGVIPGVSYAFNDKFGITSSIGGLGYYKEKDNSKDLWFSASSEDLKISLYYKF